MGRTISARRAVAAALAGVAAAAALTGCTAAATTHTADSEQTWSDRMSQAMSDPDGSGGSGGSLDGGGAMVFLGDPVNGHWDVLEVCTGAERVRVTVKALIGQPHGQFTPGATLGSGVVLCGATLRIPITADHLDGIDLLAHTVGPASHAQWNASIVRPGWSPDFS